MPRVYSTYTRDLINSVSVETPQGYKTFSLMHGDITETPTDLLVISTHNVPDAPLYGNVLGILKRKYNVVPDRERRWLSFAPGCWTSFQENSGDAGEFSALLTVFVDPIVAKDDPVAFFDRVVQCVFASIAALEYSGHSLPTISLPMIAGNRLSPEHYPEAIESLIRHSLRWLKQSSQTQTIQFVIHEQSSLAAWDAAMNKTMGRSLIAAGSDAVLASLCQEIVATIHSRPDARLAEAAGSLASALAHQDRLSIETVCVWGRKLAEAMLVSLLPKLQIKLERDLAPNIDALERSKFVAPWITSYMHGLRIFGNESVHVKGESPGYHPSRLDKGDLVSALSAIRALLSAWPEIAANAETKDTSHATTKAGMSTGEAE